MPCNGGSVHSTAEARTAARQEGDDDDMESGGPINSEETVRLLVAVVDERIEGSRGDDGPEQGSGGIGDLVAHLVRTEITPPSNFHQCTVYYLTSEAAEDEDLRAAAANLPPLDSISMVPVILGTGKGSRNEILLGTEPRKSALYPAGTTINGLLSEDEEGNLWKLLTGGILESGWTGPQVRR